MFKAKAFVLVCFCSELLGSEAWSALKPWGKGATKNLVV